MLIFLYKITKHKKIIMFLHLLVLFALSTSLSAFENSRTLLYLNSLEYKLLCNQIYSTARHNFNQLNLNDVNSTILEQNYSENLPLAIITDIDETILLNYEFQKMLFTTKHKFTYELFEKYINMKTAIPIEGSLEYYKYLASQGIKILYVSNRKHSTITKTYEHLKELGYPVEKQEDILLQNGKDTWMSNKSTRRKYIAKKYKIIQIFGDSLLDFAKTEELANQHKNKFGKSWFILPNPFYGNWLK